MINKFRRFHLLIGLFITHPCLWKCLQTFLAIKFHFELLIFFIVFLILNNTILILKKNLVLKDYRPVLMVFLLSRNGILHSVLLSVFYALNVLLFLSSALIYLHIVNKKNNTQNLCLSTIFVNEFNCYHFIMNSTNSSIKVSIKYLIQRFLFKVVYHKIGLIYQFIYM